MWKFRNEVLPFQPNCLNEYENNRPNNWLNKSNILFWMREDIYIHIYAFNMHNPGLFFLYINLTLKLSHFLSLSVSLFSRAFVWVCVYVCVYVCPFLICTASTRHVWKEFNGLYVREWHQEKKVSLIQSTSDFCKF